MQVREIMTPNVQCIGPERTVQDAARAMENLDVGFLPICENDRLIGTLTDRDIVLRAIANGKGSETRIRNVMSTDVYFCFEDDPIEDCGNRMRTNEVRRMLVLNRDKRLVGVVSLGDLSKVHEEAAADTLREISQAA